MSGFALGRTDLEILRILATDARTSRRQVARTLGMSTPSITNRIERLEREGVIRSWAVGIDRSKLGFPLIAYVGATAVQGANQSDVIGVLRALPETEAVYPVTGSTDLMITLRVRDIAHLRLCIYEKIQAIPGILRTETLIALHEPQPADFDLVAIEELLAAKRGSETLANGAAEEDGRAGSAWTWELR